MSFRKSISALGFAPLLATAGIGNSAAAPVPLLLHSLFDPSTNAESGLWHGISVATDGNIAAVGSYFGAGAAVRIYDSSTMGLLHTLPKPDGVLSAGFGETIAMSGTRVVVGAAQQSPTEGIGRAYIYDLASPTPTAPLMTLTNPHPETAVGFGYSVAMSGTYVVIGAPYGEAVAADRVYVYDLTRAAPYVPLLTLTNPTAFSAMFGYSVAISGKRLVVGAPDGRVAGGVVFAGNAYVYDLASLTPGTPIAALTNPAPAQFDYFGAAVTLSTTSVAVGAYMDDAGATDAGSVYVYDFAAGSPTSPLATLTNPAPAMGDGFGRCLAISNGRLFVGAPSNDSLATNAGSLYKYDLTSPLTPLIATLNDPTPMAYDAFGYSVAASGTRLLVGAIKDDATGFDSGNAFVYYLESTVPLGTLTHSSPALRNLFGRSVAVSGTRLVVGATADDAGATNAGAAYVYDLAGLTPAVPVATLHHPAPHDEARFGLSVGISGTRVVVGAPGVLHPGTIGIYDISQADPGTPILILTNSGFGFGGAVAISGTRVAVTAPSSRIHVYDLTAVTPATPVLILTNPAPATIRQFGSSVSISGTRVAVGSPGDDSAAIYSGGSAHVYDLLALTPTRPVLTITNPSPAFGDSFGGSVSLSGPWIVIGAAFDDTLGSDSGSAYAYNLASPAPAAPVAVLNNPAPFPGDLFGYSVSISGALVVVGALDDDSGALDSGSAYLYDMTSPTRTVPVAVLTNPSPAQGDNFAWPVAIDGSTIIIGAPFDDTTAMDRGAAYVFGPGPVLRIAPGQTGTATISWLPAAATGFVLQYNDALPPANWVDVGSGGANPVTVAVTNSSRFYRLFKP